VLLSLKNTCPGENIYSHLKIHGGSRFDSHSRKHFDLPKDCEIVGREVCIASKLYAMAFNTLHTIFLITILSKFQMSSLNAGCIFLNNNSKKSHSKLQVKITLSFWKENTGDFKL